MGDLVDGLTERPDSEQPDLFQLALDLGRRHPNASADACRSADALTAALDGALGMAFTQEAQMAWGRVTALIITALDLGGQLRGTPPRAAPGVVA